jgi:hypothetical protein
MSRIEAGIPNMVVLTSDHVMRTADGRTHRMNEYVVPPEIVEQFRQGYRCMDCLAVQDEPFPEVCQEVYRDGGGCGYRMREYQTERFLREFGGERALWADPEPVDREREAYERRTGLHLPPGARV